NRGLQFESDGDYIAALHNYEEAMALRSYYPGAIWNRARTLKRMGRADEAEAAIRQEMRLLPEPVGEPVPAQFKSKLREALFAYVENDFHGAVRLAGDALNIDATGVPGANAHFLRAFTYWHLNDDRQMAADLKSALSLQPQFPAAIYVRARFLLNLDKDNCEA